MNTHYSEIVGTLSRALGNTLDRYEEQEGVLLLHIRWPLSATEKESVKWLVRYMLPGAQVRLSKWAVEVRGLAARELSGAGG